MNGPFLGLHQQQCQKKVSTSLVSTTIGPQQEQTEPLIHNSVLIAEILSFVLTTTKEFARLRRVCKSWKNDVLPYFLEHHSHHYPVDGLQNRFFLRVCYDDDDDDDRDDNDDTLIPNAFSALSFRQLPKSRNLRSPKFLPQLIHLANHHRFAGKRYDDLDVWQDMSDHPHTMDFWESVCSSNIGERRGGANDISVQSLLLVSEKIPSTCSIYPQRIVNRTSHNVEFASYCQDIAQTDSWPQFCDLGEEALNEGMFLSMEDYDIMAKTITAAINEGERGSFAFESRIVPVIFTVRFRLDGPQLCRTQGNGSDDNNHSPSEVCFQVRIPKPTLDDVGDDGTGDLGNYNEHSVQNHMVENSNKDQDGEVGDTQRNHSMAPFVKYLSLNDKDSSSEQRYAYAKFMGYNVQSAGAGDGVECEEQPKPGAEPETTQSDYYTCHVPMSFAWWELMQLLIPEENNDSAENINDTCALEDQGADSFLPLDWLWRTCQERSVQEGVGIMDGLLADDRQMQLRSMLTALAADSTASTRSNHNVSFRQWQGRHPEEPSTHHIAGRNALVDPDLYAYSERHSTLNHSVLDVPPCSFPDSHLDPPILQTVDYWGRSYNGSSEYQWLPTYVDVGPDGKSTIIRDYINNIVPRSEYAALYDSLGHLFSLAVPLMESVFSYCRVAKRSHVRMVESSQQAWHPLPPSPLKEKPTLLRGQSLQVITQIEEYDLNATDKNAISMEESWHVKGVPHEEIVATAMYVLPSDENHQGNMGTIQFQRAFFNDEANYLFSTIDRDRPSEVEADIHACLLPLGQAVLIPGRLLVFPNSHVSKMKLQMQETTDGPMHKLYLIVFHLVNPEKRIISTREVGTQQGYLPGGTFSPEQARAHRIELQEEREYTIPDWNVRQIHLL